MSIDTHVYHVLTVTGFSDHSYDEATKSAIEGAWENHHEEFERFVSYEVVKMAGYIEMRDHSTRSQAAR